ncbi:MAG: fluoride efflux transporter FluC [Angustibacter sp.]
MDSRTLVVIAVGGGAGSAARAWIAEQVPRAAGIDVAALLVNMTGCLAIGLLHGYLAVRPVVAWWVRPFWGVGMLGGFTTFSAVALDLGRLLDEGREVPSAFSAVLVAAVVMTAPAVLAVVAGSWVSRRWWYQIASDR